MVMLNELRPEAIAEKHRRRFWTFVSKTEEGCWPWLGFMPPSGMRYGRFVIDGKRIMAHRVAFALTNGPVPSGLVVMHTCDNPQCVRPSHLKLGTIIENRRDCVLKGRHCQGDKARIAARERMACKTPEERRKNAQRANEATRAMVASRRRNDLGRWVAA